MCLQFSMNGQRKRNETRIGAEFCMRVDIVASFALFLLFFFILLRIHSFSNDGSFDNFVQHWNSTRRNQCAVGKTNHEYSREKNMKNVAFSILKFFFVCFANSWILILSNQELSHIQRLSFQRNYTPFHVKLISDAWPKAIKMDMIT